MGYLVAAYCIISSIVFYLICKKFFNPLSIFNFWWGIGLLVSTFGFYGINVPKDTTYLTFFIGLFFFNFGGGLFILFTNKKKDINIMKKGERKTTLLLLEKVITILVLVSFLILFSRTVTVAKMIFFMGYSYEYIRYYYFYTDLIISGYGHLINQYLIVPVIIIGSTFFIYQKSRLNNKKKLFVLLLLASVLLHAFSSGGRLIFIYVTLSVLFSLIMVGNKQMNQENLIKMLKVITSIVILIFILYFFTTLRGNDSVEDVIQTFTLYFTGSYAYYEKIIPFQVSVGTNLYGLAFFGGIADMLGLLKSFFGINYESSASIISEFNQLYLDIGGGNYFNAFPTYMYTFMYDYGYVGLILGSAMFGAISSLWYKNYLRKSSFSNLLLYIVVIILVYESTMRWYGIFSTPWMIMLFSIFVKIVDRLDVKNEKIE